MFMDCQQGCDFIDPGDADLIPGSILTEIQLPTNFDFKFEVKIGAFPAVGQLPENILDVNSKNTPEISLFKVYISAQNELGLAYNNYMYTIAGPPLDNDPAHFTIVRVSYSNGEVSIWSGETPSSFYNFPIVGATVDAPETVYNLYASAFGDGKSGGKIKKFVVTGKFDAAKTTFNLVYLSSSSVRYMLTVFSLM